MNMKKCILSLAMVCVLTLSLLPTTALAVGTKYDDTANHWAENAIDRWSGHGIVQGSNGEFDPNGELTCAQLATILAKLLKLPVAKDAGFNDNAAGAWYYDAINRCAVAGILNGNGDGTVDPNGAISRERAMVMLGRALGIKPLENPDLTKFSDAAKVAPYAQGMVAALIEKGIVGGVTSDTLAPQDDINRASTVTILDRAIGIYADKDGVEIDAADADGLILIAGKNVTVKNAPKGASVLVCEGASGTKVNGKTVPAGSSITAEEQKKPVSGGSGGGSSSPTYSDLTITEAGKTVSGGTYQNVTVSAAVGDGTVTLNNVTIRGNLTVQGGGSNSIHITGCTVGGKVTLDKASGEPPRLNLIGTNITGVEVRQKAILEGDSSSLIGNVIAIANLIVKGDDTKVGTVEIPAGESTTEIIVNGGTVSVVNAKGKTTVTTDTGTGKVKTVKVEAAVTVASGTVDKVEVPASAPENVDVTVSGSGDIEVEANGSVAISTSDGANVEISTTQDSAPNVTLNGDTPAHVHKWNSGVITTEPTCTAEGTKTFTCIVPDCDIDGDIEGNQAATKTEPIAKLSHTEVVDVAVAATCTEKGKTEGKHCSVCNAVLVAQTEIPAKGHTEVVDAAVDATCTTAGKTEGKHCSVCNMIIVAQQEVPATGHTPDSFWTWGAIEGKHYKKCLTCGEIAVTAVHVWNDGEVTTEPTCTEAGVKTYTCTACGATKTEAIPALSHTSAGNWSYDATHHWHACTNQGCTEKLDKAEHNWNGNTCSVCGKEKPSTPDTPEGGYALSYEASSSEGIVIRGNIPAPTGKYRLVFSSANGNYETGIGSRAYSTYSLLGTFAGTPAKTYTSLAWTETIGDTTTTIATLNKSLTIAQSGEAISIKEFNATHQENSGNGYGIYQWEISVAGELDSDATYILRFNDKNSAQAGATFYPKVEDGKLVANGGSSDCTYGNTAYLWVMKVSGSVDADGNATLTYTPVGDAYKWTVPAAGTETETASASIYAASGILRLDFTAKGGYTGKYYVDGKSTNSAGSFYHLANIVRTATEDKTYSFTIQTSSDSGNTFTDYVTAENVLTVQFDETKKPNVSIMGQENGSYRFKPNNSAVGMYIFTLYSPEDVEIRSWYVGTDKNASMIAPYEGCYFTVREATYQTGDKLPSVTVTISAEEKITEWAAYDFSTTNVTITEDKEDLLTAALNAGGKVKLESDVTITNSSINRGGDVELDLNGHTINVGSSNTWTFSNGKKITITDNSDSKTGGIIGDAGISAYGSADLTLRNITVSRLDTGKSNGGVRGLTVENCKFTYLFRANSVSAGSFKDTKFECSLDMSVHDGNVTFEDCTITSEKSTAAISIGGTSEVVFTDISFSGAGVNVNDSSSLTINSGNYICTKTNGTMLQKAENATVVINGGTYNTDPSAYVNNETHTITKDESEGTWTVTGKSA